MIKELLVIEHAAENWEQALQHTSAALLEKNYVKDSFYQACVDREKIFPTGLPTQIPVAIPHTDPEHVNVAAVCLMRLENPVKFASMEDSDETVDVEFVFNMALAKSEDQLAMIQAIIGAVQDSAFWQAAKTMPLDEIYQALYKKWSDAGVIE